MKRTRQHSGGDGSNSYHRHRHGRVVLDVIDIEDIESDLGLEELGFKFDSNDDNYALQQEQEQCGEIIVIDDDDDDDDEDDKNDNNQLSSSGTIDKDGGNNDGITDCKSEVISRKRRRRRRQRRKQQQQQIFDEAENAFHALTDDINLIIFQYLGPNQFLFVAGTCRQFYRLYVLAHGVGGNGSVFARAGVFRGEDYDNNQQQLQIKSRKPPPYMNTSIQSVTESIPRCKIYLQEEKKLFSWPDSIFTKKKDTRDVLELCIRAARRGNLQVLQYLLLNETLGGVGPIMMSIAKNIADLPAEAAKGGHLHVLKWLREDFGCNWNSQTCTEAARGGHLELLQYARSKDCPWNELTGATAAQEGHLELLEWAKANGCPWDGSWICKNSASGGHLHILKWAHKNAWCEWHCSICASAASNGHLEVLKWARANGCPWNSNTTTYAAQNGHLDVLKWAIENGCKWNVRTLTLAAQNGHPEVIDWASENGFMDATYHLLAQLWSSMHHELRESTREIK